MIQTSARDADRALIESAKGIMFDIDGCLVLAEKPGGEEGLALPGAVEIIAELRRSGVPFVCFTNGSSRTPHDIAIELRTAGIDVNTEDVLTPADVAAGVISRQYPGGRILAFGGKGLLEPLAEVEVEIVDIDAAIEHGPGAVDAVVVGWDTAFGREKIQIAAEALRGGARLYCTSDAPAFASHGRLNVGVSGFIAAGLSHVSGAPYELLGKPSGSAMMLIAERLGLPVEQVLVVGDDLVLESSMARGHGAASVLITTGMTSRAAADSATTQFSPHAVVDSLYDLGTLIAPLITSRRAESSRG